MLGMSYTSVRTTISQARMALDFPDSSTDGSFRTPSSIRAKLLKLTVASCNRKTPSAAAARRQPAAAMLSTQRAIVASA
jgi:ABC-type uncharacterized transport system permease subunit